MNDIMSSAEFNDMVNKGVITKTNKGRLQTISMFPEEELKKASGKLVKKKRKSKPSLAVNSEVSKNNESNTWSFNIYDELPTLNDYINTERGNMYAAANNKKHYTQLCANYAESLKSLDFNPTGQYNIELYWTLPDRRRDHDNLAFGIKFIQDGLVEAEVLENDGPKFINNISHIFNPETGPFCITVTLSLIHA